MHTRYNSESDDDYSPSELSGEDDPLEFDSQTEDSQGMFTTKFNRKILENFGCGSGSRRLPRPRWWTLSRRSIPKTMIAKGRGLNFCLNST